jgi:hypothetical protein
MLVVMSEDNNNHSGIVEEGGEKDSRPYPTHSSKTQAGRADELVRCRAS